MKIKINTFNKAQAEQMLECEKLPSKEQAWACRFAVSDLAQNLRKKAGLFDKDMVKIFRSGELNIKEKDFRKAVGKSRVTCDTLTSPIPMTVDEIRVDPEISTETKLMLIKEKALADKEVESCKIGVDALAESIERKADSK